MSRQRVRKVTATHARKVPNAAGEGGHGGLEKGIVQEHKAKLVRKLGFDIYCNVNGTVLFPGYGYVIEGCRCAVFWMDIDTRLLFRVIFACF